MNGIGAKKHTCELVEQREGKEIKRKTKHVHVTAPHKERLCIRNMDQRKKVKW